jgi:tyrosinase
MNQQYLDAVTRHLASSRSRRQVLATTGRGIVGGVGAALIARGFDLGLLDGGLAPTARAQGTSVAIKDFAFEPETIEVAVGDTVTWTNTGTQPHTATANDLTTFRSPELNNGDVFTHTFTAPGPVQYHCEIHPGMRGTVNVVEGATPTTTPTEPYERPNVHNLAADNPTLASYAAAIGIMKGWDLDSDMKNFARSWRYQANIHMTWMGPPEPAPPVPEPPGWNTCEHNFPMRPPTRYFWPWHRMYLYWFERIVRELSGDDNFALPYWDYSAAAKRVLPDPFLDKTSHLYIAERHPVVNAGEMPIICSPATPPPNCVPESIFDACGGITLGDYDDAHDAIENTPHGGIHVWVGAHPRFGGPGGGWMLDPRRAARDPIFWLHHANIDRLWESWLALKNTKNPDDEDWLNHDQNDGNNEPLGTVRPYDFFDEFGNKVTKIRVVKEVLTTAMLGYKYEALFDPEAAGCSGFMMAPVGGPEAAAVTTPAATPAAPLELGSNAPAGGIEVGPAVASVPVPVDQPEAAAAIVAAGGRTELILEGIRGGDVPAVAVEVYINLPENQKQQPDFRSPYYVGNLNLFGLLTPHDHAMAGQGSTQRFNIARNVAALEATQEWTGDVEVTLVPYYIASPPETEAAGATPEAIVGPWITVESVSINAQ